MKRILCLLFGVVLFNACDTEVDDLQNEYSDAMGLMVAYCGIVQDDDMDLVASKNETVYVEIHLENTGTIDLQDVKARISSQSPYVATVSPQQDIQIGEILAGEVVSAATALTTEGYYYSFKFQVAKDVSRAQDVLFNVELEDSEGNIWNDVFIIPVGASRPGLKFSKVWVVEDNSNDKSVNRGEDVSLLVFLKNTSTYNASDVEVVFGTDNLYVTNMLPSSPAEYGDVSSSDEVYGTGGQVGGVIYSFKFKVAPSAPLMSDIIFDMHITDGLGNYWYDNFLVTIVPAGQKSVQFDGGGCVRSEAW